MDKRTTELRRLQQEFMWKQIELGELELSIKKKAYEIEFTPEPKGEA